MGGGVNLIGLFHLRFSTTAFGLLVFGDVRPENFGPADVAGHPLHRVGPEPVLILLVILLHVIFVVRRFGRLRGRFSFHLR